jgi:hypothetical protein
MADRSATSDAALRCAALCCAVTSCTPKPLLCRTLTRPSPNSTSMTSFTMGSSPEWCTPTPRRSIGSALVTCGRRRSASESAAIAAPKTLSMRSASALLVRCMFTSCRASSSHWRLLRANTMTCTHRRRLLVALLSRVRCAVAWYATSSTMHARCLWTGLPIAASTGHARLPLRRGCPLDISGWPPWEWGQV